MLEWLRSLDCDVVLAETEDRRVAAFPPYDLGISFLYTQRIPVEEVARRYRWVNFHPGPLPEYRGRNVAYHAIMESAKHFGATVHYMDPEFDTGEIIEVSRFLIEPDHTAGDLVRIARDELIALFKRWMPRLLDGRVPSYAQGEGRYYRRERLDDIVPLTLDQERAIRALTVAPRFYAHVEVGGRRYELIPLESGDGEVAE